MSQPDANCTFCKIVSGDIPSSTVYEDEAVLAFLDIGPLAKGHTLVIPKAHHVLLTDLPAETMAAMGLAMPQIARGVMAATGAQGFNVLQANGACAGQVVDHVHVHIIPRNEGDGLGYRWKSGTYGDGEMKAWQRRISEEIVEN